MSKIIKYLKTDYYIRLALLSSVAAALSFFIGGMFPGYINAAIAAITALISVKPTFHDSAAEALRQVLGTILGALLGLILIVTIGYSSVMIFIVVFFCFLLAKFLKLGVEGAAIIGVTVILVVGPFFDVQYVETRFLGVLLGSIMALIFSLWVRPGKPQTRALHDSVKYVKKSTVLLSEVSDYLLEHNGKVERKVSKQWVLRAESLLEKMATARRDAESALKASKWSPLIDKKHASEVLEQIIMSQVTVRTTYNIVRDLFIAAKKNQVLPESVAETIALLLSATADAAEHQSSQSLDKPSEGLDDLNSKVIELELKQKETSYEVKKLEETQSIMLAGSLLRDAEKIKDVITQSKEEDKNS